MQCWTEFYSEVEISFVCRWRCGRVEAAFSVNVTIKRNVDPSNFVTGLRAKEGQCFSPVIATPKRFMDSPAAIDTNRRFG